MLTLSVRLNKDFLKQVLSGEKALLNLGDVRRVCVPMYDELSVTHMWKDMQGDEAFMRYFPDKLPKGRLPDREYFFNILMTVHGSFLIALIEHASKQRNEAGADKEANEVINVSPEWWAKLTAIPFKSCKCHAPLTILQLKKEEPCIS
jgi:hypothetical protein